MKKFKQLLETSGAPAQDYKVKKDEEEEVKGYKPRSKGEEDFVAQHQINKVGHPVATNATFTGDRVKGKKSETGEKHDGYSEKGEPILKTYSQFAKMGGFGGNSYKGVGNSAGEKAPVMQGSSKLKENAELTEDPWEEIPMMARQLRFIMYSAKEMMDYLNTGVDPEEWYQNKLAHIHDQMQSLYAYAKGDMNMGGLGEASVKDNIFDLKKEYEKLTGKKAPAGTSKQAMVLMINKAKQGMKEELGEALKPGTLKLDSGETVNLDSKTANALNSTLSQLNGPNKTRMQSELMKNKNSFMKMVTFANSVTKD